MISFFVEDIDFSLKDKQQKKNWLKAVSNQYNRKIGELNYIFCNDNYLLEINKSYLDHDYFTDIITFDQSESDKKIDGDIYISVDRVKENAITNHQSFENELNRVMVHGVLHLLGFKDKTPSEETKMRALENEMLSLIN
jgi:probable rRNA maturation factor